MCRVIELHIGKMRPFLFITSLVHSLGPPISPKRSKYDISFSYLHSLFRTADNTTRTKDFNQVCVNFSLLIEQPMRLKGISVLFFLQKKKRYYSKISVVDPIRWVGAFDQTHVRSLPGTKAGIFYFCPKFKRYFCPLT